MSAIDRNNFLTIKSSAFFCKNTYISNAYQTHLVSDFKAAFGFFIAGKALLTIKAQTVF